MNNEQPTSSISETSKITIGQKYQCTTENMVGFILFNTETDFEMQLGPVGSENNIRKGTYTINEDKIVLTVKLDSNYMIMETGEPDPTFKEYEIRITIINNEELNYTTDFGATYTFKFGAVTADVNTATANNLLEEIYSKYPELKDKEQFIFGDENEHWLLDKNGKKIYFYDLASFETALEKSKNSVENSNNTSTDYPKTDSIGKKYVDIPKLQGLTEKQAVEKIKALNVPYQIKYQEDISKEEGIVLDQSYKTEVITNYKGEIVAAYSRSVLYEGETLYIFVNKIKERTITFDIHRTCLIENYIEQKLYEKGLSPYQGGTKYIEEEQKLKEDLKQNPLKLKVKANDKVIFTDNLTIEDLNVTNIYECKSSKVSYKSKRPPILTILVNDEVIRTVEEYEIENEFYSESGNTYFIGFKEHGAG